MKVNHKSTLATNEPFILAAQAQQVYYTVYPCNKGNRLDWWVVYKVKARSTYGLSDHVVPDDVENNDTIYQENFVLPRSIRPAIEIDREGFLNTGYMEEVGDEEHASNKNDGTDQVNNLEEEEKEEEGEEEDTNEEDIEYMSSSSDNC